MTTNLNQQG
jgi:hypothetical protein